jgi:AbrB family looped-hinge helix DNA binding protein
VAAKQYTSKVSRKGQVTVPVEIRRRLGLRAGDSLVFVAEPNRTVVKPAHKNYPSFAESAGIFGPYPGGREALLRDLREMRGGDED